MLRFEFVACGTLPEDEVRRIAGIELGRVPHPHARVQVLCGDESIEVRARQDMHSVGKTMSVVGVDDKSRARLVALAAAELVLEVERLSRSELEPPAAQALPPAPKVAERYRVLAGVSASLPMRGSLVAFGPLLVGEVRPVPFLGLVLGLEASQGERSITGGELRLRSLAGELGLRALYPGYSGERLRSFAKLSVLASSQELRGTPRSDKQREGASFRTTNFGARLSAGAEYAFLAHGVASLELSLSRYARALKARNEGTRSTVVGPWSASVAASVGVRW